MAVTQYIGARYVPLFANPAEWDSSREYEPLTIVLYQGASYTSKQAVPSGIAITDENFWARTGDYNAQVEQYRQEVRTFDGRITTNANNITALQTDIADEETARIAADDDLQDAIDAEIANRIEDVNAEETARINAITAEETARINAINAEETARINADTALENSLTDTIENEITPLKVKNLVGAKVVTISDSYGRGVGSDDDRGWPAYFAGNTGLGYMLNISNSGAGFVDQGHSTEYNGLTFQGQVEYAAQHLNEGTAYDSSIVLNDLTPGDIDLVIIAGGYNDWNEDGVRTAARTCINKTKELFYNARICFYPLISAKTNLSNDYIYNYFEMSYGCAQAGAQVYTNSLFWLYAVEDQTSYSGDDIHPNNYGYTIIGNAIKATCMGGTWETNTYTLGQSAEGFEFGTGCSSGGTDGNNGTNAPGFRCGVQNGMAFFGGCVHRTGYGDLFKLPSYCKNRGTEYLLAFAYGNGGSAIARLRQTPGGWVVFQSLETGSYSSNAVYDIYVPKTVVPLGTIL